MAKKESSSSKEVKEETKTNINNNQDTKIYKILAYIGVLWLVGLLVPDVKDDESVKFHVGQGMLITIASFGLNVMISIVYGVFSLVLGIMGAFFITILMSIFFGFLYLAVNGGTLALMIIGILNANNGKDEKLPIIGQFAFYK